MFAAIEFEILKKNKTNMKRFLTYFVKLKK